MKREDIRNIAIIAHVDHGKTTLVDELLKQSGVFRANQAVAERVMDSGDIERERGITILSKNTAGTYKEIKINIIDTPGHADFGGEVERVLKMVNGVILVVDAFEGSMPQTKFVLRKALELELPVIVCINKIDRPDARPAEVIDEVLELLMDLDASDAQLDCPFVFASARDGYALLDLKDEPKDMTPLFETIINSIPAPEGDPDAGTQVLISTIDYNEYVGRIGVGKVDNGSIRVNQEMVMVNHHSPDQCKKVKISRLYEFDGLNKVDVTEAGIGSIVAISGIADIHIGDTLCSPEHPLPIPFQKISEPTISMDFLVNDSPLAGKEGKYVTSRHIQERLERELDKNLALRVEKGAREDMWIVYGRGVLHLSVLIETMRREGYELQVGQPQVIIKEIDGRRCEPVEALSINVPEEYSSKVIDMVTRRKGDIISMQTRNDRVDIEFQIPSRGIIGLRNNVLTATAGEAIMAHRFLEYQPWKGDIERRTNGSLIAMEAGTAYAYAIDKLQDRGRFFIAPMDQVYEGEVIGEHTRSNDITVNVTKAKQLTNMRASGSDDKAVIVPPRIFTLEEALEYIKEDEYVEVTPHSMRLRKILLHEVDRKRAAK